MDNVQTSQHKELSPDGAVLTAQTEEQIIQAVRSIRFGSVEIILQDGKIVQLECKEKVRLAR